VKILKMEDLGKLSHLPPSVRKRATEIIRMLDGIYGVNRDHLNNDGGWVEIIETEQDLEGLGGSERLRARESADHVGSPGSGWMEIFILSNNETGITVFISYAPAWLPSELAKEMADEAASSIMIAPEISAQSMRVRTGIYPIGVTRKLAGILDKEIDASGCDISGGVTVRFTERDHGKGGDRLDPIEVVVSHSGVIRRLGDFSIKGRKSPGAKLERNLDFDLDRGVLSISGSDTPLGEYSVLFDSWQHRLCHDYLRGAYRVNVTPL